MMKTQSKKSLSLGMKAKKNIAIIATYVILILLSIIWVIPMVWIILQSFRCEMIEGQLNGNMVSHFFPKDYGFDNYIDLFKTRIYGVSNAFVVWWFNTLIVSICSCLISSFLILSVAYCMSKLRFKFRKPFMNLQMVIGLFPGFMSMIAIYYLLKALGLTQSLFGLILAYSAGAGMGFQVAKGFFDVIPSSLVESAKLDGCSNFKIFVKIILPLSKPIIIYTALMSFTGPWMDFMFAKVIMGGEINAKLWTVSVGLYSMMFGAQSDPSMFTKFAAGCVCVGLPIVLLFMFLQKYYVEGVTAGAVKG